MIVLTVHPFVVVEPVNAKLLPDTNTPNVNVDVSPNDDADVSIWFTLLPLQMANIFPALAVEPLRIL
jgi:hypothetical protein